MSGATQGRAGKVPKLAADSRAAVSWKDVNNIDLDAAGNVLLTRWTTADEPHHLVRDAIRNETPLHSDDAVITPSQLLAEALLSQLRVLSAGIAHFDAEIASLAPQLPDYELFAALPGAGPTLAPRLLAAFGERRERFPNAAALQNFAGIAPVIERSGNKCWVHWRYSCSNILATNLP